MTERFYPRLAWSLFALTPLLLGLGILIPSPNVGFYLTFSTIAGSFAVVGVLVASRRPGNPIGWLFVVFAAVAAFTAFGDRYAYHAIVGRPGSLPAGDWVAWLSSGIWHPAFGFFVFAFLLFPNGRLPSPRWRPVAWFAVATYLTGAVLGLLWGPLFGEFFPYAEFPLQTPGYPIANAVFSGFIFCNFGLVLLSAASLLLRLRRAVGVERQQLKWFVYAVVLFALMFPSSVVILGDGSVGVPLLPVIPAAAGIAILRHRLYDIDLIVNRTIVYVSLTGMLVLIYLGGVVSLQYAFRALTGQEQQPQLAVVASTLVIATLFNPLRRRVQGVVDRRFYREKYDARQTIEAFGTRLRDETSLEDLTGGLTEVARNTVRPAHVSLWIREPGQSPGEKPE